MQRATQYLGYGLQPTAGTGCPRWRDFWMLCLLSSVFCDTARRLSRTMSDEVNRARLVANFTQLTADSQAQPSVPPPLHQGAPRSTSSRVKGGSLRERMAKTKAFRESEPCSSKSGCSQASTVLQSNPQPTQPRPAGPASGSSSVTRGLAARAQAQSYPTADEMIWNRSMRKLLGDLSAASTEPAQEVAPPQTDANPLTEETTGSPFSGIRKEAIKRTIQERAAGDSDDDLFASPQKASKPPKKVQHLFSTNESQKPVHQGPPIKEEGSNEDQPLEEKLPIPKGAAIVADEFKARPNKAVAIEIGPNEPLKLQSQPGVPPLQLQVPGSINAYLREYQRQGVQFLFRQYAQGIGGILADDMGLGKTVQTIAFCAALLGKTGTEADSSPILTVAGKQRHPLLIVAPSSVLDNWSREFQTWGSFRVCMYADKKKSGALRGVVDGTFEVMLVSFDTYRKDHQDLHQVPWHAIIVDEVHKLKNDESKIYKAADLIGTKLRYGLTGTVMQNSYDELWNVLSWAVAGCLGGRTEFMNYYAQPMKRARQISASDHVLGQGAKRQAKLFEVLQKYMLRRRKDVVIADQMPKKIDNNVFCHLPELQFRAYKRTLASPDFQMIMAQQEDCSCSSGMLARDCCQQNPRGGILWDHHHLCKCNRRYDPIARPNGCKHHKPEGCLGRMRCPNCITLAALQVVAKLSNHLELVKADPEECGKDTAKLERQEEIAEMVLGEDAGLVGGLHMDNTFLTLSNTRSCGKMLVLERLLEDWSKPGMDNKVLLFSNRVKMLNIIEHVVTRKGYSYSRLDGSTSREDRQKTVDRFNNDPSEFLFLISTMAGGTGLNLASANKVIVMDPSWNPANDLQAIDRAYRLGQKRDVSVYRLISTGTLEEVVWSRQLYKQQQSNVAVENAKERRYFDAVQGEKKGGNLQSVKGELFGIANLFKLTTERIAARDIVDKQRQSEALYRIEQFDPEDLEDMDLRPTGGGWDLEGPEGEDAGLRDLAYHLAAATMRSESPSKTKQEGGNIVAEAHSLQEAGVLEMLQRDQLLGPSDLENRRAVQAGFDFGQKEAQQAAEEEKLKGTAEKAVGKRVLMSGNIRETKQSLERRAAAAESSKQTSGLADKCPPKLQHSLQVTASAKRGSKARIRAMSVLQTLTEWKAVSVIEMAERLLKLNKQQRLALRQEYAASFSADGGRVR